MKKLLVLGLAVLCGVASAQVNLTTIPQGTTLSGNELILMQQPPTACNGCTVTTTPAAINSYVRSQSPAIPTSQAPSAQVGTSAVTGATGYYMDAGSAPPLNLGITPTWTGLHTFNAGIALNSITSSAGVQMNGATGGAPGSGGINATVLEVNGASVATTTSGCINGSFSAYIDGFVTTLTPTLYYSACGITVWVWSNAVSTGTSNNSAMDISNLPSAIVPANPVNARGWCAGLEDNSNVDLVGLAVVGGGTSPSISLYLQAISGSHISLGTFTNSGIKGLDLGFVCEYILAP